jgi:hypothetical protein
MKHNLPLIMAVAVTLAVFASLHSARLEAIPSLVAHPHDAASVKCPAGPLAQPDTTNHQHRTARAAPCLFGDTAGTASGNIYDAYAVWDDRNRREDDAGAFDLGHGFIDEYGFGAGPLAVRYKFSTVAGEQPPGNAAEQQAFRDLVDNAFAQWSALQAVPPLITGLQFERVTGATELTVRWIDCAGLGQCGVAPGPPNITFDSNTGAAGAPGRGGWSLEVNPANVPNDEFHFLSTAIHEVGHVVGLDEQDDGDDVMIRSRDQGCPQHAGAPAGSGPCFNAIDADSRDGALDLYSIPCPVPPLPDDVCSIGPVGGIAGLLDGNASPRAEGSGGFGNSPLAPIAAAVAAGVAAVATGVWYARRRRLR